MKISYIAAVALSGVFLSTAPAAYAGCGNSMTCNSGSSYGSGHNIGYSSGSSYGYGSSYGSSISSMGTADCPAGTSPSSDGTCLMNGGSGYSSSSSYGSSSYSSGSTITSYASPAQTADCPTGTTPSGDGSCMMNSGSSMYMGSSSSSYSPSSTFSSRTYGGSSASNYTPSTSYSSSSFSRTSRCPAGSNRSSDGTCLSNRTSNFSYSSTPLNSYQGQSSYVIDNNVSSTMSDSEADYRYGSGSISQTYTDGSNTIIPFSTTSATLSNYRVPGMGSNEFLSPTTCPVNVYNPGGAQVLGCYQVSKPAPVRVSVPSYHTVRVVRPVIYVRYPVPTPVYAPQSTCGGNYGWASRYGEGWPGRCGW